MILVMVTNKPSPYRGLTLTRIILTTVTTKLNKNFTKDLSNYIFLTYHLPTKTKKQLDNYLCHNSDGWKQTEYPVEFQQNTPFLK